MFDVSDESGVGRLIYFLSCLLITFTDAELRYCANIAILNQLLLKIIWVDPTWN